MPDDALLRKALLGLRLALGVTFLSAVADRFGLYGAPGTAWVAWGGWAEFVAYTGVLNWFLPSSLIPVVAVLATLLETIFGIALVAGRFVGVAAFASAGLLALFAIAMAISVDPTAPFDYSVVTAAAAAFLLGVLERRSTS